MPRKVVNLATRKRPSEAEIEALERIAEAKGNGIAGQLARVNPELDIEAGQGAPENERPITVRSGQKGIIERPGRVLGDGSRRGARTLRRMTCYLEPELANRLRARALERDVTMSDVIADALGAYLGQG